MVSLGWCQSFQRVVRGGDESAVIPRMFYLALDRRRWLLCHIIGADANREIGTAARLTSFWSVVTAR